MLNNRRRKIAKNIAVVQSKRRQQQLQRHNVLAYKLAEKEVKSQDEQQSPRQQLELMVEEESQHEKPCWEDSEDNFQETLDIRDRNKFKKLGMEQEGEDGNERMYQGKLRKFYQKNFGGSNWAKGQDAHGETEKDINDYLNEEIQEANQLSKDISIEFHSRTHHKHNSVVTGLDWHKNVLFSTGLDHKLKVWSLKPDETNPELKNTLEKDIYFEGLPLSSCYYVGQELFCGTLRKNVAILDTEKWKTRYSTSSFMSKHKTYQNLKVNKTGMTQQGATSFSLHSENCITLLDRNLSYIGNLFANQQILDLAFSGDNLFAVTDSSFYSWNLRTMRISDMAKTHLGYTKIAVNHETISIGSRLGNVYLYDKNGLREGKTKFVPFAEVGNMLTHITSLNASPNSDLILSLSKWKANAARIIDASKGQCVGNWPTTSTKMSFPVIGSFNSTNLMAVGSTNGFVTSFQIK